MYEEAYCPLLKLSVFWYRKCYELQIVIVYFINISLFYLYKLIYLFAASINY